MANQEQNPPQQEQPFVAAKQVGFNLKDIILNTNNEVALLYPKHNNKDYFKYVSDFISKCCLRKPFTRSPNMYKEYLAEFWYLAKALENSKVSFSIPTGGSGFPLLDMRNKFLPKELLGRAFFLLGGVQLEPMVLKAPNPSSNVERVPQGARPGAKPRHKKHSSSNQPSVSSKEAIKGGSSKAPTGSKTSPSKKRKESSSAMDSNPSQPLVSTPVDPRMHKEDQQATGSPTSLGVTSEARVSPHLSSGMTAFNLNKPNYSTSFIIYSESASGNDASAASIVEADPGNSAPSDFVPQQ
ncbi:hypothetical protein Tco_1150783 [Tanacetum coccineum]